MTQSGFRSFGKFFPCKFVIILLMISVHATSEASDPHVKPSMASELIKLGKSLFHDKRLSADGTISCATCHVPEKAFADGLRVAKGIGGQQGTRNTPTLLNVGQATSLFWDGRRTTLEEQAKDPFVNSREHGFANHAQVVKIVRTVPEYRMAFKRVFNVGQDQVSIDHIARAIAAFERSLSSHDSPFDRYVFRNEQMALTDAARRGLELFRGRARCAACHTLGEQEATFTDNDFHSLGIGYRKIEPRLAEITAHFANNRGQSLDQRVISDVEVSELGRFAVTLNPQDIAKFRTPSLRNVELTAPYMHDGSVATLEEAVDLEVYYRGAESGHPLALTARERADLVEFLKSLSGDSLPRNMTPTP